MDRRSWLWRRKSSEKSPGETDSSGSISSYSERFSDDQGYAINHFQSPEAMSKAVPTDEEVNDNVKTLTEKLSDALLNISAKEELVKQHAKVAEEAVSGWEKAEQELSGLKKQLESSTKKNTELEDRLGNLDAALKECVRQLRQAREEQDRRISEVLAKRTSEWETTKSELETQLVELQVQLQTAKSEAALSVESDLQKKLEAAERENSRLKHELLYRAEELEIRIMERDLSTNAAETASKQHLESIKKVAKLEAECRRLKSLVRKASSGNDHKSFRASSIYVESCTDSQSDSGERLLAVENEACKTIGSETNACEPSCADSWAPSFITEQNQPKNQKTLSKNHMVPSVEIDLMDDFLEMERLAALPDTETGSSCLEFGSPADQSNSGDAQLKAELQAMIQRIAELEEKLQRIEDEKVKSETALSECQRQLKMSKSQLTEASIKLVELQAQIDFVNHLKQVTEEEIKDINAKRELAESKLKIAEAENKILLFKVNTLDAEVQKEQTFSAETLKKCQKMENELSKLKHEAELRKEDEIKDIASFNGQLKLKQEKELAVAASKFAECQKTISSLDRQLKSLATLEDFLLESEKSVDEELRCPTCGEEQWRSHSGDSYSGRDNAIVGVSTRTTTGRGNSKYSKVPVIVQMNQEME